MHEVSETVPSPAGFLNVSGYTGAPLPLAWGFESPSYATLGTAGPAAQARSNLFGALMDAIKAQPMQAKQLGLPVPFLPQTTPYNFQQALEHSRHGM